MRYKTLVSRVEVEVTGTQLTRFLSLLLNREIFYEKAGYQGTALRLTIPAKQYRLAAACAKKAGVRMRIKKKKGAAFFLFRHRRRKWALFLLLPVLIALFLLPHFIWTIEIEGLESLTRVEMLSRLETAGLSQGTWQGDLDIKAVQREMLLTYPDLSFLSLSLEGSVLKVLIREAVSPPELRDRTTPCDIVATETCVIYSIVTESGLPLVERGDVVEEGDVLILGQVVLKDDAGVETALETHASGQVLGKLRYELTEEIDESQQNPLFDENKERWGFRLYWGSHAITIWDPRAYFENCELEAEIEESLFRLPIGSGITVSTVKKFPYQPSEILLSEEEMKERLQEKLEKRKEKLLAEGNRILLLEELSFEKMDGGLRGTLAITVMEDVGKMVDRTE